MASVMNNAPVKFILATTESIRNLAVVPGQYILVKDPTTHQNEYVCYDDDKGRHTIKEVVDLAYDIDRQVITPSASKFYYIIETNCIYRYVDNQWVRINAAFVIQCNSKMDLPVVGDPQAVYFVKNTNQTYYYNADDGSYYCAGADWHNIELIDSNFTAS